VQLGGKLVVIVKKEVKEILRDPRLFFSMILVPTLLFPLMGVLSHAAVSATMESSRSPIAVGVLNLDRGSIASEILSDPALHLQLAAANITLVPLVEEGVRSREDLLKYLSDGGVPVAVVVPENFTRCVSSGVPAIIEVYSYVGSIVLGRLIGLGRVRLLIDALGQRVREIVLSRQAPEVSPEFIVNPLLQYPVTVYRGEVFRGVGPEALTSLMYGQGFAFPVVTMLLIILATQMAAVSVASEKEEKTLETLLSLPIGRSTILLGKLTGSILIAVAGFAGFMLGFQFYLSSVMGAVEEMPGAVGELSSRIFAVRPEGYALLGLNVLLSLLASLSAAVILAAMTEDVRSAQSLLGAIYFPMIIGYFGMMMYMMGGVAWIKAPLTLLPFTSPMLTWLDILRGDYAAVAVADACMAAETAALIYIAARLYATERIMTMRIRLRGRGTA